MYSVIPEDTIQNITIDELHDHPDNPRLFMREDVVEGIRAQLEESGRFDPAHALLVRPVNGHYQIVRGHHRKEAAKRAGLQSVPCWVRAMSDEEAYMQLALGNVQGELSPLEIGIHAQLAIPPAQGKIGEGIQAYAHQLGKDRGNISRYRDAAEVYKTSCNDTRSYIDKAQHLAVIHKTPRSLWPLLAQWLVTPDAEHGPSANQAQELVKQIRKFCTSLYDKPDKDENEFARPNEWQSVFLSVLDVATFYLQNEKPAPDDVKSLVNAARVIRELIREHEGKYDAELFPYTIDGFLDWLRGGVGTYAWDINELNQYRQEVIEAARNAEKPPEPDTQPGEWYRLGQHLLYCGDTGKREFWEHVPLAAFAFADPPYGVNKADWDNPKYKWAHDWLLTKAPVVAVTPGIVAIQRFFQSDTKMPYGWSMAAWLKNGMTRGRLGFGNWIYIALFANDDDHWPKQKQDVVPVIEVTIKTAKTEETSFESRKPAELMTKLIELFTKRDEVVIDPFLGSGTTLFAADEIGRVCIGGDIEPEHCNAIIRRWQEQTGLAAEPIGDKDAL